MIDHNVIKLYQPHFKCYDSVINNTDICYYFEPAKWNKSVQKSWRGIEAYIEYLDKDFYKVPDIPMYVGKSNLDFLHIALIYKNNEYHVSLRSWLNGTAIKDNKINYISWYEFPDTKRVWKKRIAHLDKGSVKIM